MRTGKLSSDQIARLSTQLPAATKAVVWASDEKFLPLVEVAMKTFVKTLNQDAFSQDVALCLFHDGLSQESLEILEKSLQLPSKLKFCSLEIPKNFPEVHPAGFYANMSYLRLLIPSVFAKHDTVLYLDADLWILQDLSPLLLNQLPGGNSIGAVTERAMAIHVKRKTPTPAHTETRTAGEYLRKKVGVEVGDYLQAGVLVFHPNQMNAALFDDFWVDRVKSYPYWFGDQDVLNSYVKGRFARLDESWNYQVGFSWPKSPAKKDVRILHIAGLFRPWLMYLGKFYRPYHEMVMRASERYGSTDFFSGKPSAIATMTALMFGFMLLPASLKSLLKRVRQPSR